jgi:nicotinate-nucleotide adenylyltransferase
MRIAFFGGSFDPPHRGHLAVAQAAADRFALDQVLFAPVGSQPLKDELAMASYADRLAMAGIACTADPRFSPSELDRPRPGGAPNYTYDTISHLHAQLLAASPANQLFCLLGADSFHTFAHWHRASELLLLCDFIVAARPGYALANVEAQLPAGIAIVHRDRPTDLLLSGVSGKSTMHLMLDLKEDVSATALRQALAQNDASASDRMLPPGVADYILTHHLYRDQAPLIDA